MKKVGVCLLPRRSWVFDNPDDPLTLLNLLSEESEEEDEGSEEEEPEPMEPKIIDPFRGSNLAIAHLLDMPIEVVREIVHNGTAGGAAQIAFCPTAGTSLTNLTGDERASVASACASVLNDNDVNVIVQGVVIVLQVCL